MYLHIYMYIIYAHIHTNLLSCAVSPLVRHATAVTRHRRILHHVNPTLVATGRKPYSVVETEPGDHTAGSVGARDDNELPGDHRAFRADIYIYIYIYIYVYVYIYGET